MARAPDSASQQSSDCFNASTEISSQRAGCSFPSDGAALFLRNFARIHRKFQTPSIAVIGITLATLAGLALGDALLVPVTEVGSMASACGWFATCVSLFVVESRIGVRLIAALGSLVALVLLAMKLFPIFPGHFTHRRVDRSCHLALHWSRDAFPSSIRVPKRCNRFCIMNV